MDLSEIDAARLDADLDSLAHASGGFERPETLMRKLQTVLDLEAVIEIAGPMKTSRAARLDAFKTVLRQAVDRILSDSDRLEALIYFFLLTDDEVTEHSLDPLITQAKLGERRAACAAIRGGSANTFRNGGEQRLCALVAGELLRYETEVRRIGQQSESHSELETNSSETNNPTPKAVLQALTRTVSQMYRSDYPLQPLASLVVPDKSVFYDTAVTLGLQNNKDDPTRYFYRLSLTFSAAVDEYVVAYVSRSHLTDVLLTGTRLLTDCYSFSSDADRDACYERLCGSVDVVTLVTSRGGRTRHQSLKMESVPPEEYEHYLGDEHDTHGDAVKLLRVTLPSSSKLARLIVKQEFEVSKSDHFCYWVADRPIYVQRLQVDTRSFSPPDSSRNSRVTLQPFMMATNAEIALSEEGTADIETDAWLIRGQGFAVIW